MKSEYNLSKDLRKSKDVTARLLFNSFDISIKSRMVDGVCNIDLFLIAADYFSTIIACKFFCKRFLNIVV